MVKLREWRGKRCWFDSTACKLEVVDELTEYMAYCCVARGNWETTIVGKLVSSRWGKLLPLDYSGSRGIKTAHVKGSTHQRVKRTLSWEILRRMEGAVNEWGVGRRVAWIGLVLSYFMFLNASELFEEELSLLFVLVSVCRGWSVRRRLRRTRTNGINTDTCESGAEWQVGWFILFSFPATSRC